MVLEMFDKLQFGEVCLVLIRMILTTSSHTSLYKSIYRNSLFFRLVNFRRKNIRVKNFRTDQIERKYFTSRVWWALIEEIAQCAEEMATYTGSSDWGSAGV